MKNLLSTIVVVCCFLTFSYANELPKPAVYSKVKSISNPVFNKIKVKNKAALSTTFSLQIWNSGGAADNYTVYLYNLDDGTHQEISLGSSPSSTTYVDITTGHYDVTFITSSLGSNPNRGFYCCNDFTSADGSGTGSFFNLLLDPSSGCDHLEISF